MNNTNTRRGVRKYFPLAIKYDFASTKIICKYEKDFGSTKILPKYEKREVMILDAIPFEFHTEKEIENGTVSKHTKTEKETRQTAQLNNIGVAGWKNSLVQDRKVKDSWGM